MKIRLKRVYEEPAKSDGIRVLVERLWPRGVSKERAKVDHWLPDIAPTTKLRKWYQHDPAKWPEFRRRYIAELVDNKRAIDELEQIVGRKTVTFVFASKEKTRNSASVLKSFLDR